VPKYGYLVVEGPHDVEFASRLLSSFGLVRVQMEVNLDPFLKPLVPRAYPPNGDLLKRMSTPLFLQSATHAIAIHSAIGDTRLVETIQENASLIDFAALTGVGILLDADAAATPPTRYQLIRDLLRDKNYAFPDEAGTVSGAPPHLGAFVLPDNVSQGTLEYLLLDCAEHVYPSLLAAASTHVDAALRDGTLSVDDKVDLFKPAGRHKAIIGGIAAILRPGKAIQVSIQDNRWLRGSALELPRVKAVQEFLATVLELR
jgi:hypothetical protein